MVISWYLRVMKKKKTIQLPILIFAIVVSMIFMNCKSADRMVSTEKKASYDQLLTLLEGNAYRIDVNAVRPFNTAATTQVVNNLLSNTGNTAGRIDVSGAGHYLEMRDGTTKGSLPYFGEQRQGGSNYGNTNGGVEFEGIPENYELLGKPDKNRVVITFKMDDSGKRTEYYEITIIAFPGGTADIRVFPSQRSTIAYSGNVSRIEDKM